VAVREVALLVDGLELSIHIKDGKNENSGNNDQAKALIKQIYMSFCKPIRSFNHANFVSQVYTVNLVILVIHNRR
jgi:hypothetical protein